MRKLRSPLGLLLDTNLEYVLLPLLNHILMILMTFKKKNPIGAFVTKEIVTMIANTYFRRCRVEDAVISNITKKGITLCNASKRLCYRIGCVLSD